MEIQNIDSKKSSSTSKWLLGLGIGCGVVILLGAIVVVGGFFYIKNLVQGFEESKEIMETITERYGRVKDFCPDPDGAIRAERIEAFLAVREAIALTSKEMEETFRILSEEDQKNQFDKKSSPGFLTKVKTGIGLIPQIADFFKSRNQALLDNEIGLGEYYYIYVIAYFSWLEKSPIDGPDLKLKDERGNDIGVIWESEDSEEDLLDSALKGLHRQLLPMLHNQYEKLIERQVLEGKESWREILAVEIEAMESDRFRLPWQDGLPEVLKASLQPFRSRLESSYSPMLNPLEVAIEQR